MSAAQLARRAIWMLLALTMHSAPADAQAKPQPRPRPASAARQPRVFHIDGYAMVGRVTFTAAETFTTILGKSAGPMVGGGARVGIPLGGLFIDVGAWRYRDEGERVVMVNNTPYRLGIPLTATVTPFELSAGWRFRFSRVSKLTPYVAGGITSTKYQETSSFNTPAEDVDETFNGSHLFAGAEYRVVRWVGAAAEVHWTTVPDALGHGGVSKAFNDTDLGGRSFRFKITIGR